MFCLVVILGALAMLWACDVINHDIIQQHLARLVR